MKQYLFYAINFIDSNFVTRSNLYIDRSDPNNEIVEKKSGTYKYDVDENYIRYEWIEENGMSNYEMINRKTLDLIISYSLIKTKCKIVDINKNDPFKKIENYKIPIKKEPKKNIL